MDRHHQRVPIEGKVFMGYADVAEAVSSMAQAVIFFRPDVMVAIGYPGLFIAKALETEVRKALGVDQVPIVVVQLEIHEKGSDSPIRWRPSKSWDDHTFIKVRQWFDEAPGSFGECVRGQRVLIVDAIDDTRATLQACAEQLAEKHDPSAMAVFVLHDKVKPKVGTLDESITYIVAEETRHAWICYPWDATGSKSLAAHEEMARRSSGVETMVEPASTMPSIAVLAVAVLAGVVIGASIGGARR